MFRGFRAVAGKSDARLSYYLSGDSQMIFLNFAGRYRCGFESSVGGYSHFEFFDYTSFPATYPALIVSKREDGTGRRAILEAFGA